MLNKEKYAKEILDIICDTGELPAVIKGKPYNCEGASCEDCKFYNTSCYNGFKEWANSEYVEREIDWAKVPVDTPVYVRDNYDNDWHKGFFKGLSGMYYGYLVFEDGGTEWSTDGETDLWDQCKIAEGVDCSEWYKD